LSRMLPATPTRCVQRLGSAVACAVRSAMADPNRGRIALPPRSCRRRCLRHEGEGPPGACRKGERSKQMRDGNHSWMRITASISTVICIGSEPMPTAERACRPRSPSTATNRSEQPFMTLG